MGLLHYRRILYHLSHRGSLTSVKNLFQIRSFWGSGVRTSTYILWVHNWIHNTPSIAIVLLMCSSPPLPPVCGPFQAASCWNSPEGAKRFPSADTSHVIEAYCTITIGYNSYMHCTHWSLTPHNNPMWWKLLLSQLYRWGNWDLENLITWPRPQLMRIGTRIWIETT